MASDVIDLTLTSGGSDDEESVLSENLAFAPETANGRLPTPASFTVTCRVSSQPMSAELESVNESELDLELTRYTPSTLYLYS